MNNSLLDDLKLQFRIGDVTTKLIFWNIALFAIPAIVFGLLSLFNIKNDYLLFVSLSSKPSDLLWKPWSLISYAFFHSGFLHIIFNLLMLNFVGKLFTTFFTQKQLLNLYMVSAIFAGLLYISCYMVFPALSRSDANLVGASGAIMAILVATATYQPMMEIRVLLIGNVKLVYLVLIFFVLDLIQLPISNTGGHLAHIGGAFFGYFYIRALQNGTDVTLWFEKIISFFAALIGNRRNATPFKKVHKSYSVKQGKTVSKIVTKDKTQQQIDEILDKISKSGYDSLSKDEKEFLFKAEK
jgi:membrane associated rhomboid family serine protease